LSSTELAAEIKQHDKLQDAKNNSIF